MKLKKIILTITALIVAFASVAFSACTVKSPQYKESIATIDNPDQGFYRPIYVRATEDGVTYNKNIVNASTRLYHLRVDISAFSAAVNGAADKQLSQAALDGLDGLLLYLKEKDKNAVVRFAYDPSYGGSSNKEPAQATILKHIEQVCPILDRYESTVTAIEAGLIGPWGEMHSSTIANAEHINPIIEAFLENTTNIPLLVRTPKMIYNYLGITINDIDGYTVDGASAAYRLGLFNDGYLGSSSDLGTYTDRLREIEFLSGQTAHLPYGGEVVIPSSNLHDITACLPEMFQIHLSYLNVEWNNEVINKWKNSHYTKACGGDKIYYGQTAFTYIQNHMGYRFVLKKSSVDYSEKSGGLTGELKLENVGFGNLFKKKFARLIVTDGDGQAVYMKELGDFTGEESFNFSAEVNLHTGEYGVYLQLYGDELSGEPRYLLQFATEGVWDADLKANKLGSVKVK